MTHSWTVSADSTRDIMTMCRDGLFAGSIILRDRWEPVVPIAACPMRPSGAAEMLRKCAELNQGARA